MTEKSFGGNRFGGQTFGGNRYGGNRYGGKQFDRSAAAPLPAFYAPGDMLPNMSTYQEEIERINREKFITQLIAESQRGNPGYNGPEPMTAPDIRAPAGPGPDWEGGDLSRNLGGAAPAQVSPQPRFVPGLGTPQQGISPSSAGPEHAGPMSARATTQLQPGGMDQMGFAEQMAAREEIARALNGTGGSNMLTRLFGMDR